MASSSAATVIEYLDALPDDRRRVVARVRDAIRERLPNGYVEQMDFGMISYVVPLDRLAATYNGHPLTYAALAAQKNHYAVYLMGAYGDGTGLKRLQDGFASAGKTLDMGKSCVRFRSLDDIALDAITESIASMSVDDYVALYERSRLLTKAGARKAGASK